MKTVARFTTRHVDGKPGETDLFLGVMMKACSKVLKPDTIYEIRDVLGELMIVPVGPVAHPKTWNCDVSTILDGRIGEVISTKDEYRRMLENNCEAFL